MAWTVPSPDRGFSAQRSDVEATSPAVGCTGSGCCRFQTYLLPWLPRCSFHSCTAGGEWVLPAAVHEDGEELGYTAAAPALLLTKRSPNPGCPVRNEVGNRVPKGLSLCRAHGLRAVGAASSLKAGGGFYSAIYLFFFFWSVFSSCCLSSKRGELSPALGRMGCGTPLPRCPTSSQPLCKGWRTPLPF